MFSPYNAPAMRLSPRFARLRSALALAAIATVAPATPALATTYVPVSDQALIERAAVIGTFEVISSEPAPTATVVTEYRVRVETLLKGDLPGSTALVRVPGGVSRAGNGLRLSGMPSFQPGERGVLLFLVPRSDGAWGIAHVILGAFHALERHEGDLLVRPHLAEARRVGGGAAAASGDGADARDRERFLDWIADRVAGRARRPDYFVPVDASALAPRFTLFRDEDTGYPLRWFDFDAGDTVVWRSSTEGPTGYPDEGMAAVRAGLAAWSNLTQATIELVYGGFGPNDGGFDQYDFVNTVMFEDPNGEIEEEFDCEEGGVLAIGGPFYDDELVLRYKSQNWHPIGEGVVITNSNLSCYLLGDNARLAEILGHELGHTLGLRHSCGGSSGLDCASNPTFDDALMRATVHDDGRGARLGADDMAGGRALYGPVGGGTLKAPTKLTAQLVIDDVTLLWNDRSSGEEGFRIYRRLGGGSFEVVGETGAGVTSFADLNLGNGTWTYEVRAFNEASDSEPSNRVSVVVQVGAAGVAALAETAFYGSEESGQAVLTLERVGGASGPLSVRLRTGDLSAAAPLDYGARDLVVTWDHQDDQPKLVTLSIVDDFTAEASELIEVLLETVPAAGQTQGFPLGAAAAVIADNDGSPGCAAADRHLCLLGGRFKVEVEWRNQRNGERGFGHALAGSDQSGYFWFFQMENVELIVKALDGRPLTGAHWLFYGALSDVEYWVTVTDTATGSVKLYRNEPGNICGVGDTTAFPQAAAATTDTSGHGASWRLLEGLELGSEPSLTPRAACVPGPLTLCILGGRFQVDVTWRDHRTGQSGVGSAIPFSDLSGFFWFDNPASIELVVKALDGRVVNGQFWFFYGALSDVEYTIRVTDTVSAQVHSYSNAGGNICGAGDIFAFPG